MRNWTSRLVLLFCCVFGCVSGSPVHAEDFTASSLEFFEREVRPLLASKCFACHSDAMAEPQGGLRLDSRQAVLAGGDSGAAAVPGDIDASLLLDAIGYESGMDMPPDEPLSASQQAILRQWIEQGIPWPTESATPSGFDLDSRREHHWSWQPLRQSEPPVESTKNHAPNSATPYTYQQPLDTFIRADLDKADLSAAPPASRTAILRRLYFDLVGVPPTVEELDRFLEDESPLALTRVIDGLLADPRLGVRWGRHWLDVVRFAETYGHEFDFPIPYANRYRDWVIESINDDLPYDQFVREQIAGDLLPTPRLDPHDQTNRSIVGSAFLWFGDAVHAPVDVRADQAIRIDNQIDVLSKSFLGMTLACARCHDHKFDAISQQDYYAISGLLQSTTRTKNWLDPHQQTELAIEQVRHAADNLRTEVLAAIEPLPDAPIANPDPLTLFDFADPQTSRGTQVGWAFEPVSNGLFDARLRTANNQTARLDIEPAGWLDSARLGKPAVGIWRSAPFEIKHGALAYRAIGDGGGEIRIVIDGHFMIDYHQLLFAGSRFQPNTDSQWQWQVQRGDLHHYIGHTAHIEMIDEGAGYVGLSEVRWVPEGSPDPHDSQLSPVDGQPVPSLMIPWEQVLPAARAASDQWSSTVASIPQPDTILASAALVPRNIPLSIRGNANAPGDLVQRGNLTALSSSHTNDYSRLDLAQDWTSATNPLVPRVAVNRLWHHLTGRGLVSSCDNFGVLGDASDHPELLDYLANDLIRANWSMKHSLHRMLHSSTYAMSSRPIAESSAKDPANSMSHAMRLRRLAGEVIRDTALQLAGLNDERIVGPSVPIHLTETMTGRGRPGSSGPLLGEGRRSTFIEVRRNFLSPMMLAFDTPAPFTTVGKRNISNVPAQALVMLNDPLIRTCSDAWADRVLSLPELDDAQRLEHMYRQAFSRRPTDSERLTALRFLASAPAEQRPDAWRELAHALMNVKEFIFLP